MIRVRPSPGQDQRDIAGAIEHLGTGEKLAFSSGTELLRLIGSWPSRGSKLPPAGDGSNC